MIRFLQKIASILAVTLPLVATSLPSHAADFLQAQGKDLMFGSTKVILKGTNFDNIGALCANIGTCNANDIAFTEADYAELSKQGGNHVRLGISFGWYQNNRDLFFRKMDEQVSYAKKHGIFLVFNQFTTPGNCYEGYSEVCGIWNNSGEQEQLRQFWIDMANRYKNEPAVAGYDILNEPNPQAPNYCDTWFGIAGSIYQSIIAAAPNQLVFISACSDAGGSFEYRNEPKGRNIVYEVHDYSPMDFSHDYNQDSTYPGTAKEWFGSCYVDKEVLATGKNCPQLNIRESYGLNWADQNNVPIYIGEWGATSKLNGYVQYTADKADLYRQWGVNHAHYTWKHQTKVTGGYYQWGIYSSPLRLDEPEKLAAVKIAWGGAVKPNFATGEIIISPDAPPVSSSSGSGSTGSGSSGSTSSTGSSGGSSGTASSGGSGGSTSTSGGAGSSGSGGTACPPSSMFCPRDDGNQTSSGSGGDTTPPPNSSGSGSTSGSTGGQGSASSTGSSGGAGTDCVKLCRWEDPDRCPTGTKWAGWQVSSDLYTNDIVEVCGQPASSSGNGNSGGNCEQVCTWEDPDECPAGSKWAGWQADEHLYTNTVKTVCK